MDVKWYRCLTLSLKSFLVVLLFHLPNVRAATSAFARITECSARHLNYTLTETPGGSIVYTFQAACLDNSGSCVYGESQLGFGVLPSRTSQVSLDTSCPLSNTLSPSGLGHCTLQISTSDVAVDTSGIAFLGSCTLTHPSSSPTTTSSIASTVSQSVCTGSSEAPTVSLEAPTVSLLPTSVGIAVPTSIGIAVVTLLFTIVLVVAIVSSLMWFRSTRAKRNLTVKMDILSASAPSVKFSSLDGDSITQYDSIFFEEEVCSIGNVSLIDHGLVDCHTAGHTTVETPLQSSSGYVSIQYSTQ